jgi:polyribonucleotide nucleotidyltransferase
MTLQQKVEREFAGRTLTFETGHLAKQASGTVTVRYGDTVVMACAVYGLPRPGLGFFPLTVEYREKTYAAGKFPGGFFKREGRPTTKEILTSRLIDRPLRPMFPKGLVNDVMITSIVLSADEENEPDVLAVTAASAALIVAGGPFDKPLAAVRVGKIGTEFVINPTHTQMKISEFDLVVVGTREDLVMVEASANEVSDEVIREAIFFGHNALKELVEMQEELTRKETPGNVEFKYVQPDAELVEKIRSERYEQIKQASKGNKLTRSSQLSQVRKEIETELNPEEDADLTSRISEAFTVNERDAIREIVFSGTRIDDRSHSEVRGIDTQVGFLPRTHGSALFTRGETQALSVVTLGTVNDAQLVEGLVPEFHQKFMIHYNFPSFCVGEVWFPRGPKRREIGHGALAERAISPVLPLPEDFPYTIRIVSDIMESNGSSSMATVSGGTLSLMDAGVPIRQPVAGIAMGLCMEGDDFKVLSDISGAEDHYGDMDFKVAGTQHGITALQMDIKVPGISEEVLKTAISQAREGLNHILKEMLTSSGLKKPREELSPYAPKLVQVMIDPDKIGLLIGPQGKNVKGIQERTETSIEIEEDGRVTISGSVTANVMAAKLEVEALTQEPEINKIYSGKVVSIRDFGAFVEIFRGKEGLLHISELSNDYVASVSDVVKVGDTIDVKLISIDDQDRIRLSHKAVKQGSGGGQSEQRGNSDRRNRGDRRDNDRRGDRGSRPDSKPEDVKQDSRNDDDSAGNRLDSGGSEQNNDENNESD